MSSYTIAAVSAPKAIIDAHRRRGFEVVTLAVDWSGAQALAKSLGMATDAQHLMVVSTMARKLHESRRSQRPEFGAPTLVVVPAHMGQADLPMDWQRLLEAAETAETEVVFLEAGA